MKNGVILFWQFLVVLITLLKPGGVRAIAAENLALKQQLITLKRKQKRSPKLTAFDRFFFGLAAILTGKARVSRYAVILKPSAILRFHKTLVQKKYHNLFSKKVKRKPGPKGPSQDLINAIVEMKKRNPRFGSSRIAQQINIAFGTEINKDVVRRILAKHYKPTSGDNGPSWLTFLGYSKDSLWSLDLFRCESATLKSHWVLLVMDQFTRRVIGFSVNRGEVDCATLCRMFNEKIIVKKELPKYLSSDNAPLFQFQRWQANLRILELEEVKSIPYTPISHPFVERFIGTVRRESLNNALFWIASDLQNKLDEFKNYYNQNRTHSAHNGKTPISNKLDLADLANFKWQNFCRGLFQLPSFS